MIPKPEFRPCKRCGAETSGDVCWECDRKAGRAAHAMETFAASVPEGFRWASFAAPKLAERVKNRKAIQLGRDAIGCPRVVLSGSSGVGKTSLVVAMARAAVAKTDLPATFVLASDLATARMRTRLGHESDEVIEAMATPLLVLDDLGTSSEVNSTVIPEVVKKRHAHNRPTWVTTWMAPKDIENRYGEDISRRVFQGARLIDCGVAK